jgi:hypothetical protein
VIGEKIVVTIQLEPADEQQLRELASSQGQDVTELASCVLKEYLHRSPPTAKAEARVPAAESQLLQDINQGLPEATWQRYHELVIRRREGTLTRDEHEELKSLTNAIELAHARRIERLTELAQLRRISLDELMDQLGIRDPGYV